ncbi:beta-xylosidase family glycoside hydrolase [Streptomyces blattellae]|uniref:beta-xylosidase family glycoside hydrolase n=1 Tax=Streptomyces blattellae TaxID=2569855 RepID=UPI002E1E6FB3
MLGSCCGSRSDVRYQLRVLGFTGAMLGLWVQDLDGSGVHADFAYATYREESA